MKRFPPGVYGRQTLHFHPAPYRPPLRAFAALVFPWQARPDSDGGESDEILLCHIGDRGWCIPSGRVEPSEDSMQTVRREAVEEAGAVLCDVQYIGCYRICERDEVRWADVYVAQIEALVPIGMPEESLGRRFVRYEELPEAYYMWNDLTGMVFEHSREILMRARVHTGTRPALEDPCP